MEPDPVISEIRENGARLAERFDFDLDRLVDYLREAQAKQTAHPIRKRRWPTSVRGEETEISPVADNPDVTSESSSMRWVDPVVEEVRENGRKFAEECGYDLDRMVERLRELERQHPEHIVDRSEMPGLSGYSPPPSARRSTSEA